MTVTERDIQHKKEEIEMLTQMLDNAKKDLKKLEQQYAKSKEPVI